MSKPSLPALSRRSAFLGASAAGALATAAAVLPKAAVPQPALAEAAKADAGAGYQLTEHVKRYYATARI